MKVKVNKPKQPMTKKLVFMLDDKGFKHLKRIMKGLQTKSVSAALRKIIHNSPIIFD